ncbi:MAG: peroxidase-related enzyme [Salibacteraceae bacterium]
MAFIDVIGHDAAEGPLREIYDNLIKSRGKLANVHQIQSLNPESIVHHMELYMTIMFGKSPLKRAQREMIAVVVSATNRCAYCTRHHGDALRNFWKESGRVEGLIEDYHSLDLSETDLLLCEFAEHLTKAPLSIAETVHPERLRKAGLPDRAILDASLVIAYFNFVNRLVLGLGVELETEGGAGYQYD